MDWKHVNEQLPAKGERVLFISFNDENGFHDIEVGEWTGEQTMGEAIVMDYGEEDDWYPCTHWMPLPALPEIKV